MENPRSEEHVDSMFLTKILFFIFSFPHSHVVSGDGIHPGACVYVYTKYMRLVCMCVYICAYMWVCTSILIRSWLLFIRQ